MCRLKQAARHYMSVFGQALEAHGIPFSKDQLIADATLREALAEQADQEPVAWEHFGIPSVNGKQAEKEPLMDYERINALREGEQNGAEDAYFFVRPENDTPSLRKMFCQGFERGFHKGLKYAAPVRTKDLTDDEIMKINVDTASIVPTCDRQFHFARAVIAAYKEKNK